MLGKEDIRKIILSNTGILGNSECRYYIKERNFITALKNTPYIRLHINGHV
jgi:hypothetical protein